MLFRQCFEAIGFDLVSGFEAEAEDGAAGRFHAALAFALQNGEAQVLA